MSSRPLTVGQLARKTGVTARAIRHSERLGLIKAAGRTGANYRVFGAGSVTRLNFIARCRSLGFSLPEVKDLL
ncbi:MerR family transcriptional regulator [Pelomicrobium sp. G1]|uniref:MerR family transcriptional regulator n=1 Tax=unclassified Pelomicrobium TaxID=2815318 RepID=UPI00348B3B09